MSCDHQLLATHVCDYVEGKLSPVLELRCTEALQNCAHCRDIHAQAREFYQLSGQWQEQTAPEWQRVRHAVQPHRHSRNSWLAWSSLAASLAAVFLVLLRMEISTANGLLISFGGSQTDTRVQQLLAEELARYTATRDALLDTRLAEFAGQQLSDSELLLARWQEASRAERRQELDFLMSGWQSQRYQDQQVLAARMNQLADSQMENNQYLNALMQNTTFPGSNGL